MSKEYHEGRVKWFNRERGYGFIVPADGGLDVFVHSKHLRKAGIDRALLEGEKVKFIIAKGPKGNFADDVALGEA